MNRNNSDMKLLEERLRRHLRYEEALARVSRFLLEDSGDPVNSALAALLDATGVGRVYIFKNFTDPADGLCMGQIYESVAPGVPPEIDNPLLGHLSYEKDGYDRWARLLSNDEHIAGHIRDFPSREREILAPQGIVSILVIPIKVNDEWWGFIGFDELRSERDWSGDEIRLLRVCAGLLSGYFRQKQIKNELSENERKYRVLFDHSPFGVYLANADGSIIDANKRLLEILGSPSVEATKLINVLSFPPLVENGYAAEFKRCRDLNITIPVEMEYTSAWGKTSYLGSYLVPVAGDKGKVELVYTLIEDMTERKKTERVMSYLSAVVQHSDNIVVVKDLDLRVLATNRAFAAAAGHETVDTLLGKSDAEIFSVSPESEPVRTYMEDERAAQKLPPGEYILKEEPVVSPSGEVRTVLTKKYPIYNADGSLIATGNISVDITGRKRAEEMIKHQLLEKETLLKEVHHRIKNNIASIAAMLRLQSGSIENPESQNILNDAVSRVESMRIIYDKLLLSDDYRETSVKNYIDDLVAAVASISPESGKLTVITEIAELNLDVKKLIAIGTIINELMTNSLKYAFAGRDAGSITVTLVKTGNEITLSVRDDGRGLPENFDIAASTGFGLMLVKLFTEQLKGTLEVDTGGGTGFTVRFKV